MTRTTRPLGWRVDKWTLDKFRELCTKEGLRPSQAIERFMELSNEKESIVNLLRAAEKGLEKIVEANDAKARVLLDWLEKGTHWIYPETGKRLYIPSVLLKCLVR
jgi:CRISPR/Cas system-associated protein Cas10 (large subunit of type III CRISPR-Cas system)